MAELEELKRRKLRQLELRLAYSNLTEPLKQTRFQSGQQDMDTIFTKYLQWIEDVMTTEDTPWVQVVAALVGNGGGSHDEFSRLIGLLKSYGQSAR